MRAVVIFLSRVLNTVWQLPILRLESGKGLTVLPEISFIQESLQELKKLLHNGLDLGRNGADMEFFKSMLDEKRLGFLTRVLELLSLLQLIESSPDNNILKLMSDIVVKESQDSSAMNIDGDEMFDLTTLLDIEVVQSDGSVVMKCSNLKMNTLVTTDRGFEACKNLISEIFRKLREQNSSINHITEFSNQLFKNCPSLHNEFEDLQEKALCHLESWRHLDKKKDRDTFGDEFKELAKHLLDQSKYTQANFFRTLITEARKLCCDKFGCDLVVKLIILAVGKQRPSILTSSYHKECYKVLSTTLDFLHNAGSEINIFFDEFRDSILHSTDALAHDCVYEFYHESSDLNQEPGALRTLENLRDLLNDGNSVSFSKYLERLCAKYMADGNKGKALQCYENLGACFRKEKKQESIVKLYVSLAGDDRFDLSLQARKDYLQNATLCNDVLHKIKSLQNSHDDVETRLVMQEHVADELTSRIDFLKKADLSTDPAYEKSGGVGVPRLDYEEQLLLVANPDPKGATQLLSLQKLMEACKENNLPRSFVFFYSRSTHSLTDDSELLEVWDECIQLEFSRTQYMIQHFDHFDSPGNLFSDMAKFYQKNPHKHIQATRLERVTNRGPADNPVLDFVLKKLEEGKKIFDQLQGRLRDNNKDHCEVVKAFVEYCPVYCPVWDLYNIYKKMTGLQESKKAQILHYLIVKWYTEVYVVKNPVGFGEHNNDRRKTVLDHIPTVLNQLRKDCDGLREAELRSIQDKLTKWNP